MCGGVEDHLAISDPDPDSDSGSDSKTLILNTAFPIVHTTRL